MSAIEGVHTDLYIRNCGRCRVPYDWRRSGSRSLKMTYCGSLCEAADLGCTIEGFLGFQGSARATEPTLQEAA